MYRSLPAPARALLWVRVLNQVGAFALAFLAVLAGPHLVTAVLTAFGLAALVSRWAGGLLLDRTPPRTLVAAGLGATGLALVGLAAARTPAQILAATAATGLAFEIYEPATSELLARVTDGPQRRDAYTLLGAALTGAGAVSGLLAAVLLPLGVRLLIAADALTCLAAAVLALARLPKSARAPAVRPRRRWLPPRPLLRLTVSATAYAVGYLAMLMYLPLILLRRGAPSWLPGLALAGAALLTPLAGRGPLADRPRTALLVAAGLTLALAGTGDLTLTVVFSLASATACGVLLGRWQTTAAERAPDEDRPRWFAFVGLSWGVAQPAVPGVVGLAAAVAGGTAAAPVTAAVAFTGALLVL